MRAHLLTEDRMHFGGFGRLRQGLQGGGLPVRPPSAPELGPCRPCLRFTGRDRRVQSAVVRSLFVVVLSPFTVNTPRSKPGLGAAGGCGVSIGFYPESLREVVGPERPLQLQEVVALLRGDPRSSLGRAPGSERVELKCATESKCGSGRIRFQFAAHHAPSLVCEPCDTMVFVAELEHTRDIHDAFRLPGRVGREPAWGRCAECGTNRPVSLQHRCGEPLRAFWCLDMDECGLVQMDVHVLSRTPTSMRNVQGIVGPFDAAGVGAFFAARLKPA